VPVLFALSFSLTTNRTEVQARIRIEPRGLSVIGGDEGSVHDPDIQTQLKSA
jgi:hypothetical protein